MTDDLNPLKKILLKTIFTLQQKTLRNISLLKLGSFETLNLNNRLHNIAASSRTFSQPSSKQTNIIHFISLT